MAANAEMIEYWNTDTGNAWVREQEALDRFLDPIGGRALAALGLHGGERVLDVGCGCGQTSLALGRMVGEHGSVTGVDVSRPMLGRAAERAMRERFSARLEWLEADAQTAPLPPERYDAVFSRFGVMFFSAPGAAFANLARATRRGGRLAFVCWQSRESNRWFTDPLRAVAEHVQLPSLPEDDQPGPFGLASGERTEKLLREAGWEEVKLTSVRDPLDVGRTLEDALELLVRVGPTGAALRNPALPSELRERILAGVREKVEAFVTPAGVRAPGGVWLVTAQRG